MAVLAVSATQHWATSPVSQLLSDPLNWSNKKNPSYGVSGGDSNLGGFPTGTYTLNSDMTANRIVFDSTGAIATFDLGAANTLTLCGLEQTSGAWAFGVPPAGSNATLRLVSGTISIPYAPKSGWTYTNCVMKLTRESSAHDFRFVVSGSDSVLKADRVMMDFGRGSILVVENGGLVTNNIVTLESTGNSILVDGAGSRLKAGSITLNKGSECSIVVTNGGLAMGQISVGASSATSNSVLVSGKGSVYSFRPNTAFTLGSSVWSKYTRFEVTDGGAISNLTKSLYVGDCSYNAGGYSRGHVFAFRGANTRQTLAPGDDKLIVGRGYARQCRFEVTDGAHVTLASTNSNWNRFWVGTGPTAYSNAVYVAGEGSLISGNTSGAWLVGQHGRYNKLEIRDGGTVRTTNIITIGQGDNDTSDADENALVMENGGHLECVGLRLGYGDGAKQGHANHNHVEILSGSTVTNTGSSNAQVWVGYYTNSCDNVFRISGGSLVSTLMVAVGRHGSRNKLVVENEGSLTVTGGSLRAGENYNDITTTSNRIEILSGGKVASVGLYLQGVGAGLTISNGTVRATGDVVLPYAVDKCYSSEPVISIAGTNSLVYTTGTITIASNAVLSLTVPAGGYCQPPFQTASGKTITIRDLGQVTFGLDEFLSGRTVLARAGGTLFVDTASLQKMNEGLPENTIVKMVGSELVLARNTGATIIIR